MTVKKVLQEAERKWPTWLISIIITVIIALIGMWYAKFLADKHPQIYLDVLTSTSVLDIKEDLPTLGILFDGLDIRQQNLSLRIISVKIINDSSKDILKGQYDLEDPVGLMISSGKIIKADLLDTSNEYLEKTMSLRTDRENIILFKDVILAAHQYFSVKLLVLHPVDQTPSVKPIGYIAGMKTIKVRETFKEKGKESIWSQAFLGPWLVQSLRLLVYFLGAGILSLLVAALIISAGEHFEKSKLKRNVRRFIKHTELSLNESDEFIFSRYIWGRDGELKLIKWILNDDDSIKRAWEDANNERQFQASYKLPKILQKGYPSTHNQLMSTRIDALVEARFIQEDKGVLIVDPHMKETLTSFLAYLRSHNLTNDL